MFSHMSYIIILCGLRASFMKADNLLNLEKVKMLYGASMQLLAI